MISFLFFTFPFLIFTPPFNFSVEISVCIFYFSVFVFNVLIFISPFCFSVEISVFFWVVSIKGTTIFSSLNIRSFSFNTFFLLSLQLKCRLGLLRGKGILEFVRNGFRN